MQTAGQNTKFFLDTLKADKQAIDADITSYIKYLKESSITQYGEGSKLALDAYCDILSRGGKRLRGALVIEGYRMSGGTNEAMILQVARAMEMIHAYMLVIDDIQDRSKLRRGGPTAHVQLTKIVKDEHLAESLATNAAMLGDHAAMMILANIDAPAELRSNVLSILNRTLVVTAHGQIADALYSDETTEEDVRNVQEWKTATYTILNPLHVGMVLAGADCHVTDGVTPYAHAIGQAFQMTDDIIGTFGTSKELGKNPIDDIREGKRTLLVLYALKHAPSDDRAFLRACLGNADLTEAEFTRCKQVIRQTSAVEHVREQAEHYISQARTSLRKNSELWSKEGTQFLDGLALYLQTRTN